MNISAIFSIISEAGALEFQENLFPLIDVYTSCTAHYCVPVEYLVFIAKSSTLFNLTTVCEDL